MEQDIKDSAKGHFLTFSCAAPEGADDADVSRRFIKRHQTCSPAEKKTGNEL
jgi:hypothetical protein